MANYTASNYVQYGQLLADYSYLLAQQASPYLDQVGMVGNIVKPTAIGGNATTFEVLYANSSRTFEASMDYGLSVALLPVAFTLLGLLTLCVMDWLFCMKLCFTCLRCKVKAKKRSKGDTSPLAKAADEMIKKAEMYGKTDERALRLRDKAESERSHNSIIKQRKRLTGLFVLAILLPLTAGLGLTYIAHTHFEEATTLYSAALSEVAVTVSRWDGKTTELQSTVKDMNTNLPKAQIECDAAALDGIAANIEQFNEPLPALRDVITAFQGFITSGEETVATYLVDYRSYAVYALAGISFLSFTLFASMTVVGPERKHCLGTTSMCCGQCVVFLYSLLALPFLLIAIVLSDFCVTSPMQLVDSQVPAAMKSGNGNATDIFLTCDNPISVHMTDAAVGVKSMHEAIGTVLTAPRVAGVTCPDLPGAYWPLWFNKTSVAIYKEPSGILPTFVLEKGISSSCPTFQPVLQQLLETNVCGSTYDAIFVMTVSICLCSFTTFLCLLMLPWLNAHYSYMLKVWEEEDDGDETDSDDELDPEELLGHGDPNNHGNENDKTEGGDSDVGLFGGSGGEESKEEASIDININGNEEDNDSVSKVTEFDWTKLDDFGDDHGSGNGDPYHNPNANPSSRGGRRRDGLNAISEGDEALGGGIYLEEEGDVELGSVKSVEDVVHYEAINEAGYEDDM